MSSSNVSTFMIILRRLRRRKLYHLNSHDNAKNLSWRFWKKSVQVSKITSFWIYKYDCIVSPIPQCKMQFKIIFSVLLLFVAQTMA